MSDRGRARAVGEWWRNLTTGWRLNVGLYALATIALIALLVEFATGGTPKPKQVQVASQARPTTTSITVARPTTTVPPSTTTVEPPTTAAASPSTTAAGSGRASTTVKAGSGGGGGGGPTTTAAPSCPRNATDSRCGPFRYDPAPAGNQPLSVTVSSGPAAPKAGDTVTFTVSVSDPDHSVTANCSTIDFGDGQTDNSPTCPSPDCHLVAYGPWEPPAATGDSHTYTYLHVYAAADKYTAKFVFHTDKETRCPPVDPYGNTGSAERPVTVASPGP